MNKSLAIYFFYDEDGIVDEYVIYYLKNLQKLFTDVCVVSNGKLEDESLSRLNSVCTKVIERKNEGFDSWAYKEAIEFYGYDYISSLDKLVLNNFTCYGPIYPFEEMFEKMDLVECDFWGHCLYAAKNQNYIKEHFVYPHLMSYFICFRQQILKSSFFKKYWDTLEPVLSYEDAIINHEIRCTQYFESLGFKGSSFIETKNYSEYSESNLVVFNPLQLLILERNPLLKRKIFEINDKKSWKWKLVENFTRHDCMEFIRNNTAYPLDLIYSNLERTYFKKDARSLRKLLH